MQVVAWQYNSPDELARIFVMKGRMAGLLPVLGRDNYVHGHGRLTIRLFDKLTVADGKGPEFDQAELLVWLNDAVFLAPTMLLSPAVSWTAVDDDSFDLTLTNAAQVVRGRVLLDGHGAPVDFHADRYATLPGGTVLTPWRTPVTGWQVIDGRPFPGPFSVFYDLADGPFCYLEGSFQPGTVAYNSPL
jgi:hypothetical protein